MPGTSRVAIPAIFSTTPSATVVLPRVAGAAFAPDLPCSVVAPEARDSVLAALVASDMGSTSLNRRAPRSPANV